MTPDLRWNTVYVKGCAVPSVNINIRSLYTLIGEMFTLLFTYIEIKYLKIKSFWFGLVLVWFVLNPMFQRLLAWKPSFLILIIMMAQLLRNLLTKTAEFIFRISARWSLWSSPEKQICRPLSSSENSVLSYSSFLLPLLSIAKYSKYYHPGTQSNSRTYPTLGCRPAKRIFHTKI